MTSDEAIPAELQKELARLIAALNADLGLHLREVKTLSGSLHATVQDALLVVPTQYVMHWKRFGVVPTALVRDAAYASKRAQLQRAAKLKPSSVEADAMAYAERFLRAATDAEDET